MMRSLPTQLSSAAAALRDRAVRLSMSGSHSDSKWSSSLFQPPEHSCNPTRVEPGRRVMWQRQLSLSRGKAHDHHLFTEHR